MLLQLTCHRDHCDCCRATKNTECSVIRRHEIVLIACSVQDVIGTHTDITIICTTQITQ